jgi:hypothetical protein
VAATTSASSAPAASSAAAAATAAQLVVVVSVRQGVVINHPALSLMVYGYSSAQRAAVGLGRVLASGRVGEG